MTNLSTKPEQLRRRKERLVRLIEQQRFGLSMASAQWLEQTASIDQGWQVLVRFKPVLLGFGAVCVFGSLKSPSRLVRWGRKAMSLWGGYRMLRRSTSAALSKRS